MPNKLMHRLWLRRPGGRRSPIRTTPATAGKGGHLLLSTLLGVGLALMTIYGVDASIRPVMTEMAQVKVTNTITAIVNDAISNTLVAQAVAYNDLVTVQTDATGRITAITTSAANINALRTQILGDIVTQVDSLDTQELGIPLGNLTGFSTASDRGPLLPVRVVSVASAAATVQNQFIAAGINQTLHQVMLHVTVAVKVLIPGGVLHSEVTAQVPVAETVIVGEVPDAYLQLGENGGRGLGANGSIFGSNAPTSGTGSRIVSGIASDKMRLAQAPS